MPSLPLLAGVYLAGLIALRMLYLIAANAFALPNTAASGVILAAVPAALIGVLALRQATRDLAVKDWATIWGVLFSVFVILFVLLPAIFSPVQRAAMGNPAFLGELAIVSACTAVLIALFLYLGARTFRG